MLDLKPILKSVFCVTDKPSEATQHKIKKAKDILSKAIEYTIDSFTERFILPKHLDKTFVLDVYHDYAFIKDESSSKDEMIAIGRKDFLKDIGDRLHNGKDLKDKYLEESLELKREMVILALNNYLRGELSASDMVDLQQSISGDISDYIMQEIYNRLSNENVNLQDNKLYKSMFHYLFRELCSNDNTLRIRYSEGNYGRTMYITELTFPELYVPNSRRPDKVDNDVPVESVPIPAGVFNMSVCNLCNEVIMFRLSLDLDKLYKLLIKRLKAIYYKEKIKNEEENRAFMPNIPDETSDLDIKEIYDKCSEIKNEYKAKDYDTIKTELITYCKEKDNRPLFVLDTSFINENNVPKEQLIKWLFLIKNI